MSRKYVDGDSVRFTPSSFCQVDAELFGGERINALEPRRLFPISGPDRYISLLNEEGKEQMIVRSLDSLDKKSAEAVRACLTDYYRIPEICAFNGFTDKFGLLTFSVETNFGNASVTVKNRHSDIKLFYGKRVLIKDASDNRYEIPDIEALDRRSRHIILSYL